MMSCEKARDLIERVVDGTIDSDRLDALQIHTETCETCRAEFGRCTLIEEVVKDAFVSRTGAEQAGRRIAEKIASRSQGPVRVVRSGAGWGRSAVAAAVVLAAGLLVGFVAGRMHPDEPAPAPVRVLVPMALSEIEGTVLVKHEDSDSWRVVQSGSTVYRGDTFHSLAKSAFVLELPGEDSTIEVTPNSVLALTTFEKGQTAEKHKIKFTLEQGECTASLESPHGPFFIKTPHGQVEALGTEFTVTVE